MRTNEKRQYQKELDAILKSYEQEKTVPKLLLHSCCAPCSSYVLTYLSDTFMIYNYFYNPNIAPKEEYVRREQEWNRLLKELPLAHSVIPIAGTYESERFLMTVQGMEEEKEGGKRCEACFRLRLEEAAQKAIDLDCDWFTTTLTISPHKNAEQINTIGETIADAYGVRFLPCDFKKKDGYKQSLALSKEYDLYRQSYCGCPFSVSKETEQTA